MDKTLANLKLHFRTSDATPLVCLTLRAIFRVSRIKMAICTIEPRQLRNTHVIAATTESACD
jgi:hypothetical protein